MPLTSEASESKRQGASFIWSAFFGSLCSGPIAIGLAGLAANNNLLEKTKEQWGLCVLAIVIGASLAFAYSVRSAMLQDSARHLRLIANAAMALPIIWAALIFAIIRFGLEGV